MSSFGTSGLFICFVIAGILMIPEMGWGAVFFLVTFTAGWLWLMNVLNSTFRPDGSLRRRRR